MPRRPKFDIAKDRSEWVVNVPASITPSGKRERRYFTTKKDALDEATNLREGYHDYGTRAAVISPALAEVAVRAEERLCPYGVTLEVAVNDYLTILEERSRSVPLATAVEAWLASKSSLRKKTLSGYRYTVKRLEGLADCLMSDITPEQVEEAIDSGTPSMFEAHRRNARALFQFAAKKGWCEPGVIQKVEPRAPTQQGEITTLSPKEVRAILQAAEGYYPDSIPAFAIAFFAGVRSAELGRLRWREVKDDGIEVPWETAKKKRRRFVPMNPTLKAWLKGWDPGDDELLEEPSNWREKSRAVRRLAGFKISARLLNDLDPAPELPTATQSWPQNAIRHTHASAAIAGGTTVDELEFAFGHTQRAGVLREHYVGVYSKKDAIAFWSMGPKGTKIQTTRAVA